MMMSRQTTKMKAKVAARCKSRAPGTGVDDVYR